MPKRTRRSHRLACEALEGRDLPAAFAPATTAELIDAIHTANGNGEADVITLAPRAVYSLTAEVATSPGTGLPEFTEDRAVTIVGNGAVIERSGAAETPNFRLLAVAAGATLAVDRLTLRNGRAFETVGNMSRGGAVLNQGTLTLTDVVVSSNAALGRFTGSTGGSAAGGGIFSTGTLTVVGGQITGNRAEGAPGGMGGIAVGPSLATWPGKAGGDGMGGGVYVGGGTATFRNLTASDNTATGGSGGRGVNAGILRGRRYDRTSGGDGGDGMGGGFHIAGGRTDLFGVNVTNNTAIAGAAGAAGSGRGPATNGAGGVARGGGIFIGPLLILTRDTATTIDNNKAKIGTVERTSNVDRA